jgi:hypothetical protein
MRGKNEHNRLESASPKFQLHFSCIPLRPHDWASTNLLR